MSFHTPFQVPPEDEGQMGRPVNARAGVTLETTEEERDAAADRCAIAIANDSATECAEILDRLLRDLATLLAENARLTSDSADLTRNMLEREDAWREAERHLAAAKAENARLTRQRDEARDAP